MSQSPSHPLALVCLFLSLTATLPAKAEEPTVKIEESGAVSVNGEVLKADTSYKQLETLLKEKPLIFEHRGAFFEFTAAAIILPRWHPANLLIALPLQGAKGLDGTYPLMFKGDLSLPGLRLTPSQMSFSDIRKALEKVNFHLTPNDYVHANLDVNLGGTTLTFQLNDDDTVKVLTITRHEQKPMPKE